MVLFTGTNAGEGADILRTFNQTLYDMEPASVGGVLPDEELYYAGAE